MLEPAVALHYSSRYSQSPDALRLLNLQTTAIATRSSVLHVTCSKNAQVFIIVAPQIRPPPALDAVQSNPTHTVANCPSDRPSTMNADALTPNTPYVAYFVGKDVDKATGVHFLACTTLPLPGETPVAAPPLANTPMGPGGAGGPGGPMGPGKAGEGSMGPHRGRWGRIKADGAGQARIKNRKIQKYKLSELAISGGQTLR